MMTNCEHTKSKAVADDLARDELYLRVEIITPKPKQKSLIVGRVFTYAETACLLSCPAYPSTHSGDQQRRAMNLKRQDLVKLLSENIAAQLAQALDTNDTISTGAL